MAVFRCRTRNNEDPETKKKVYVSYTKGTDQEFIDEVAEKLVSEEDYAVYQADIDTAVDDSFIESFREMDKVVFFMADDMFLGENRALFYELPLAMTLEKDLMPVDNGSGLIDIFLTCCEHIPQEWTKEDAPWQIRRTLLVSLAEMSGARQVQKDYDNAEGFLLRALALAEEINKLHKDEMSLDDESICLMNLGINRAFSEDWDRAYAFVRRALDKTEELVAFSRSLNSRKRKLYCYRVLGELAKTMEMNDRAMDWFDAAVFYGKAILEDEPDADTMTTLPLSLIRLAECHDRLGEDTEAIPLYTEALDLFREMEDKELAPEWMMKEMCSSAMRVFQLCLGRGDEQNAGKYRAYAGHLMTRVSAQNLMAAQKKTETEKPSTITLPS